MEPDYFFSTLPSVSNLSFASFYEVYFTPHQFSRHHEAVQIQNPDEALNYVLALFQQRHFHKFEQEKESVCLWLEPDVSALLNDFFSFKDPYHVMKHIEAFLSSSEGRDKPIPFALYAIILDEITYYGKIEAAYSFLQRLQKEIAVSSQGDEKEIVDLYITLARARCLIMIQHFDESLRLLEKGMERIFSKNYEPVLPFFFLNLAIVYHHTGQLEEALQINNTLLSHYGRHLFPFFVSKVYNNKGIVLSELGRYSEAYACFQRAIQIREELGAKTESYMTRLNLIQWFLKQGKENEAAAIVEELYPQLKAIPHLCVHLRYFKAKYFLTKGNVEVAITLFESLLEDLEKVGKHLLKPHYHFLLAQCYEEKGDFQKALQHFKAYSELELKGLREAFTATRKVLEEEYKIYSNEKELEMERIKQLYLQQQLKQKEKEMEDLYLMLSLRQKEREVARRFQEALVPSTFPISTQLDVHFHIELADELGGDFIDYLSLGADHFRFFIADVSGHGIQAAFVVPYLKAQFQLLGSQYAPAQFLTQLNAQMVNLHIKSLYVACTVVEVRRDSVTIASAGLPPPLFVHEKQVQKLEIQEIPVGIVPGYQYQESTYAWEGGDLFFFCTDGLFEIFKEDTFQLGYDAVARLVGAMAKLPSVAIGERILKQSEFWKEKAIDPELSNDDITFLIVKNRPK
jgi:serine phosphatase RsbU (regulator of sigma subunit)